MRVSFVGLFAITDGLPPPPTPPWLNRWLFLLGDVGDTCGNDGDKPPLGDKFIADVGGLIFGAIDGDKSPTPIIIAGGNWGNPGIPGTIPGGLGRNDAAGDGGNFAFVEFAIEEEGVMAVEDIEDNPVN